MLDREDIDCLIEFADWMFRDGFVNYTNEDYDKFEEIKKKHGRKESKS